MGGKNDDIIMMAVTDVHKIRNIHVSSICTRPGMSTTVYKNIKNTPAMTQGTAEVSIFLGLKQKTNNLPSLIF